MKKSLIYTIVGGACLIASTGLTLIANGMEHNSSEVATDTSASQLTTESLIKPSTKSFSQNETVYIITDQAGAKAKSFIGNTINQSAEPIPVDLKITYTLDGKTVSASEIANKSGHVKVTYDFAATKQYNNTKIPFLTVTGIMLDSSKFKNVTVKNGKIIEESDKNTIIAGYTMVGLNENLNLDLLPTTFSFESDVTDFSLETVYTFATNELFADLDTSKLNSIDSIIGQLNQLSTSFDQIVAGSDTLTKGIDSALDGGKALEAGIAALHSGATTLATGANDLANGAHALEAGAYQLSDGLSQIVGINNQIVGKIDSATDKITGKYEDFTAKYAEIINEVTEKAPKLAEKLTAIKDSIVDYYSTAYTTVTTYTGSIEALSNGANQLAAGLTELSNGADALAGGAGELVGGIEQLDAGSKTLVNGLGQLSTGGHTLYNGLITFKEQGINKLTDFANHDLSGLTNNIRSTVNAAKSYHYYQDSSAKSVKFIFKTPSIK